MKKSSVRLVCMMAMVGALLVLSACASVSTSSMPSTPTKSNHHAQSTDESVVFIIYAEQGKKDVIKQHIIAQHDDIIYEYQNFSAIAIKINADDINERVAMYQKTDGVLQIAPSQTVQLHSNQ